jgi:hypothetical protein
MGDFAPIPPMPAANHYELLFRHFRVSQTRCGFIFDADNDARE